jgi:hypothetical protein
MADNLTPDTIKPPPAPVAPPKSNAVASYFSGVVKGLGDVLVEETLPGKILLDPLITTEAEKRRNQQATMADLQIQAARKGLVEADLDMKRKANDLAMFGTEKAQKEANLTATQENTKAQQLQNKTRAATADSQVALENETNKATSDALKMRTVNERIALAQDAAGRNVIPAVRELWTQTFGPKEQPLTDDELATAVEHSKAQTMKELYIAGHLAFSKDPRDSEALKEYMGRANLDVKDGLLVDRDNPDIKLPFTAETFDLAWNQALPQVTEETRGRLWLERNKRNPPGRFINLFVNSLESNKLINPAERGATEDRVMNIVKSMPEAIESFGMVSVLGELSREKDPTRKQRLFENLVTGQQDKRTRMQMGGELVPLDQIDNIAQADPTQFRVKYLPDDGSAPIEGKLPEVTMILSDKNPIFQSLEAHRKGLEDAKVLRDEQATKKGALQRNTTTGKWYREVALPDGTTELVEVPVKGETDKAEVSPAETADAFFGGK